MIVTEFHRLGDCDCRGPRRNQNDLKIMMGVDARFPPIETLLMADFIARKSKGRSCICIQLGLGTMEAEKLFDTYIYGHSAPGSELARPFATGLSR
jgi:hypothetical protein